MEVSPSVSSTLAEGDDDLGLQNKVYLMCPPDHYQVTYEINPWMDRLIQPDLDLAREQWNTLVTRLCEAGATLEMLPSVPSLPDQVFTADVGLFDGHRFIASRFRYLQRQPEAKLAADWFQDRNYEVVPLPLGVRESMESSDVCQFRDFLLAGYGFRTTLSAHKTLRHFLQKKVFSIEFIDPRLYHLDISFCPLDGRKALVAPAAWSRRSCELVEMLVPEPLVLELDEAMTFCANSVVIGKMIIMPACPLRVRRILERWGFMVCITPVSEFLKAGGGVHCLTLDINGSLSNLRKE